MPLMVGENYRVEKIRLDIVLLEKVNPDMEKSLRMKATMLKYKNVDKSEDEVDDDEEKTTGDRKGWRVAGYFGTMSNVLSHLINLEVEKTDLKDVQTVVDAINRACREIKEALGNASSSFIDKSLIGGDTSLQVDDKSLV